MAGALCSGRPAARLAPATRGCGSGLLRPAAGHAAVLEGRKWQPLHELAIATTVIGAALLYTDREAVTQRAPGIRAVSVGYATSRQRVEAVEAAVDRMVRTGELCRHVPATVDLSEPAAPAVETTIALEDPTDPDLKQGRIAFNSAEASSTGTFACASCHPDGHTDQLALGARHAAVRRR